MPKRTLVLATAAALIAGFWIGRACHCDKAAVQQQVDPVASARSYVIAHHPQEFGRAGTALFYAVEDHGEVWTVEVAPQGQMGGGLRLMIRRADGHVELIGRTQ